MSRHPRVLRTLRASKEWTQADAAKAAGLSFYRYRQIEAGEPPSVREIGLLIRAFQIRSLDIRTVVVR
jgi:transcriptional regulator with XRE-family HTH domain